MQKLQEKKVALNETMAKCKTEEDKVRHNVSRVVGNFGAHHMRIAERCDSALATEAAREAERKKENACAGGGRGNEIE
jgi:hypothetical protein